MLETRFVEHPLAFMKEDASTSERVLEKRAGLNIRFVIDGEIGTFSWLRFGIVLASGFGLLSAAQTVTDFVMLNGMGSRSMMYRAMVYEILEDVSVYEYMASQQEMEIPTVVAQDQPMMVTLAKPQQYSRLDAVEQP